MSFQYFSGEVRGLRGPGLTTEQAADLAAALTPATDVAPGQMSATDKAKLNSLDAAEINDAIEYTAPLSGLAGDEYAEATLPPESNMLRAYGDGAGRLVAGVRLNGTIKSLTQQPVAPLPDIVIPGDSFVQGVGGQYQWFQWLKDFLTAAGTPRTIRPQGAGSQDASQIAARMGARTFFVTVTGNQVPASGSVAVTAMDPLVLTSTSPQSIYGQIQGVYGMFVRDGGGGLSFIRETPGSAVACPPGSVAQMDNSFWRKATLITAVGRNTANFDLSIIRQEVDAIHAMQSSQMRNALVLGFTNGSQVEPNSAYPTGNVSTGYPDESEGSARYIAMREAIDDLAFTYGDRFIDLHRYLVDHGKRDATILAGQGYFAPFALNWTTHAASYATQDAADIADDIVPSSLRIDGLHLNTYGMAVTAFIIFRRLRALGI